MPDVIEPAKTGRARCRGCGANVAKGELRFGEAVDNPFGEGEATHWFHLACAADKRPDKLAAALEAHDGDVPEREQLAAIAAAGIANPSLTRVAGVERAPTGRARCRECREMIAKSALRLVIDVDDESMTMATKYFVHAGCAAAHVGAEGLADKLLRVGAGLPEADLAELERELAGGA